jgi:hypothetical protein
MNEDGNLLEVCGELCQILGYEDFAEFAKWWETCPEAWQDILKDARWGDMVSFTWNWQNGGEEYQISFNAIFAKHAGNGNLVFWLHGFPGVIQCGIIERYMKRGWVP